MEKEFLDLIDSYRNDHNLNDSIRIYILNHLYTKADIVLYIDYFANVAKEIDDKVGYALSQAMYFWIYLGKDIEKAHEYNELALKLYKEIGDYENKNGYLTTLNNEIIYNNYLGILHKTYELLNEGMRIAEQNKKINYYFNFSVNCFYLLLDACLFDKAYEILNKLESNDVTLIPSNIAIMKTLKIKTFYCLEKYDECIKEAIDLKEYNDKEAILDKYIINSYLIESYTKYDISKTKIYVEELLKELSFNEDIKDNIDINEAYLALARYYKTIGNNEESFKWYKEVYSRYKNLLGWKLNALNESINSFKDKDSDLYLKALISKEDYLEEVNKTLISVSNQDKKMYDAFADFRYKFLYQKMEKLTNFIKEINDLDTPEKVEKHIKSSLIDILNAKFVNIFIDKKDFEYCGLNFSSIDGYYVYESEELPNSLRNECNSLTCIKVHDNKLDSYLYIIIGLPTMDNVEKKEITYLISLIKEVLTPVLLQIERYNKAIDNYSHDQLTLLYNRYGLEHMIKDNLSKFPSLYLLMIDIDDFKKINDAYGHDMGDFVLKKVSETLASNLGKDNVARIGGEEFIGLVDSNVSSIKDFLDKLMSDIHKIKIDNKDVTISLGVSLITSIDNFKEAKNEADKKLYKAKQNGKNKYVI